MAPRAPSTVEAMSTTTSLPPGVRILTCDNPSPMTLEGTNTYLLGAEDAPKLVVVDPGPEDHPAHLEAILAAAGDQQIGLILVTHHHHDHFGGAASLATATGAPIRTFSPDLCTGADPVHHGERISASGVEVVVLHTPGHTSDSVSFWLPEAGAMITGDTILGQGTTMLDFPDGTLTDYLASLDQLAQYPQAALLPAHGPLGAQLGPVVTQYREHRLQRLEQVRGLLADHGQLSAEEVAQMVYGEASGVHPRVLAMIAAAQLDHIRRVSAQ